MGELTAPLFYANNLSVCCLALENLIGSLPKNWNVLVGEQKIPKKINAIHYTLGGPYFKKYSKCEGSKFWFQYKKEIFK